MPGEETRAEGEAKIFPGDHSVLSFTTKANYQTELFSSGSQCTKDTRISVRIKREAPKAV